MGQIRKVPKIIKGFKRDSVTSFFDKLKGAKKILGTVADATKSAAIKVKPRRLGEGDR